MRDKIILFIEKYGLFLFALFLLLIVGVRSCSQTKEEVYAALIKYKVKHPEIVLAQSILETGWYDCDNCSLSVNNLFGLWDSKNKRYFFYDTWEDSIGGYLRGIQYRYNSENYEDYYEFLEKIGYASDPNYIVKLKKLVENE